MPKFGNPGALGWYRAYGGAAMKTLLIGLGITIVFLASCLVSAIERIW